MDVGCHIGSFLVQLKKYAPKGQHVAFEASATKSRWLKRRFPEVELISCAVANETGKGVFQEEIAHSGYSHLVRGTGASEQGSSTYEVQLCRLDAVLHDKAKLDLIKLDIEGGELAALRGAKQLIIKWRPAIIFECGPEHSLQSMQLSRNELYTFMVDDLGYEIFCFVDFIFKKDALSFGEFRKCGIYPFRAFNFVAMPVAASKGETSTYLCP